MNKLIAGFMIMFFLLSVLSGIMDGSAGAAASTNLDGAVSALATTITVDSTAGFADDSNSATVDGIIYIVDEKMSYTGTTATTFTGVIRGIEGTDAAAHSDNRPVFHEDLGIINYALGFRAIRTGVPGGSVDVVAIPWNFVTVTLPRVIFWDYAFLEGDLIILRYVLMSISTGFVIYLTYMAINTVVGVLRSTV